jgi:hypothetical protein
LQLLRVELRHLHLAHNQTPAFASDLADIKVEAAVTAAGL